MEASEVHSYLNSFANFESQLHQLKPADFSLNRIQKFLDLAGSPGKGLRIVHVAGTKGKGSTCAFLARIAQEAGHKVGLYTSPHLHRINERIRILGSDNIHSKEDFSGAITDEELASALTFLRPYAADIQNEGSFLTYFEVLTVAALCHFAKAKTDFVVLETGLGGRLDATNAVASAIAVITPISLDHTRILGTSLAQIAAEKAGIIKHSSQKVVMAPQEQEAMGVLLGRCRQFGIQPVVIHPEAYKDLDIGLKGRHQVMNAACAVETAKILKSMGMKISDEAMAKGLKYVRWPGRLELLQRHPVIIADGAHNEASARALAEALKTAYPRRRILLILGLSQDKDIGAFCRVFQDIPCQIFLTKAGHPRSHLFTLPEGQTYFPGKPLEIIETSAQALGKALQMAGDKDVIVATGSLFIAAEIRDHVCTSTKA